VTEAAAQPRVDTPVHVTVEAPAPAGDPAVIGLPGFVAGGMALGLTLVNYVPSLGAALAIIVAATGMSLVIAAVWAARLGQTALVGVFGSFAGFWLSYAALVLGLTHGWYGVAAADVGHTVALFAIAWLVVFGVMTLATLALPWVFTLLFALVELAVALVLVNAVHADMTVQKSAGWVVFLATAVGAYLWAGSLRQATGKAGVPLGRPVLK
jgi:succinate-acetate transporter protein